MRTDPPRSACGASPPGGPRQRPGRAGSAACAWWAAFAALGLVGVAHAQSSPWYVGGSYTVSHDSNLLRLATGQETPEGYARADTVTSTALLAGLDQPVGRQRVYGTLSVRDNRYSGNPRFNNTSYGVQAGVDWQTVERISGTLAGSASRALQSFSTDLFSAERARNLERIEAIEASIRVGLVTQYTAELSVGRRQVRNSLEDPGIQAREYNQDNAEAGVRWRPSSASSFGLALSGTQGRYPKFTTDARGEYAADRFTRQDVVLSMTLKPSGASTVDLRLSNGRTRYDLNQRRDFSGLTGAISWGWQPTGKLRISTAYSRDTGQDSYLTRTLLFNQPTTADYSRATSTASVRAVHDWSAKVAFTAGATYSSRDLVRTINDPLIPADASGTDRTTVLSLGARWQPRRFALLGCDLGNERRTGVGELTSSLKATTFTCFGQATLQ